MATRAAREAWRAMCDLIFDQATQQRMLAICERTGLNPGMFKALMHLSRDAGTRMGDLAGHWGCDASYITALVDSLEERGLAARQPYPADRRVKIVVLTAAGVAKREQALEILYEPPSALEALSAAEQRQLRDLLGKVRSAEVAGKPVAGIKTA